MKNTDTAKEKRYNAGKQISRIKWHIAVDDLPHAISLTKANVRKGALIMCYLYHNNINNVQNILSG